MMIYDFLGYIEVCTYFKENWNRIFVKIMWDWIIKNKYVTYLLRSFLVAIINNCLDISISLEILFFFNNLLIC